MRPASCFFHINTYSPLLAVNRLHARVLCVGIFIVFVLWGVFVLVVCIPFRSRGKIHLKTKKKLFAVISIQTPEYYPVRILSLIFNIAGLWTWDLLLMLYLSWLYVSTERYLWGGLQVSFGSSIFSCTEILVLSLLETDQIFSIQYIIKIGSTI